MGGELTFDGYHISIKGGSHLVRGTPCQDWSQHVRNRGYAMAVVSDGHGSARHFRSNIGSKAAVGVSKKVVKGYLNQEGFLDQLRSNPEETMRHITDSIITRWSECVLRYDVRHRLREGERKIITEAGIEETERVKRYGCTLICCFLSDEVMFGFQIGDGALIAINEDGEETMPMPSDEDCFLNRTTSICGSDASIKFRHLVVMDGVKDISVPGFRSICADPKKVSSVTAATDGFTTSFNSDESMMRYCGSIPAVLAMESGKKSLEENLTLRSRSNSADDVSISVIYRVPSIFDSISVPEKQGNGNTSSVEPESQNRSGIEPSPETVVESGSNPSVYEIILDSASIGDDFIPEDVESEHHRGE